MGDGTEVRTIDELKDNFDINAILGYLADGKLQLWLTHRYCHDLVDTINALDKKDPNLAAKICSIFNVENDNLSNIDINYIKQRNEKIRVLQDYVEDASVVDNVDNIAFDQDELNHILSKGCKDVYLFSNSFNVPLISEINYTGIKNAYVY